MASDLQNILQRVSNKSEVLIEKYNVLVAEKETLVGENAAQKADNSRLMKEL